MPDAPPTWRLMLLAAACAIVTVAVLGLAFYAGFLWMTLPH